ncbi:hypothetical protein Tco_0059976 [Tanacetum coccineum]
MKHMMANFSKLDKFEGVAFIRWQNKMHFLLSTMSVVYILNTSIPDDYVCRGIILNGMSDSLFDIYQNVKSGKELRDSLEAKYMAGDASSKKFLEELTLVELVSHLRIEESLKVQDSDKPKGNNVDGLSIINCGKPGHLKNDCKGGKIGNKANGSGINGLVNGSSNSLKDQNMFNKSSHVYYVTYISKAYFVQDDDVVWWVDSGAHVHVYKNRCWFKTYELLNDGSILHMGNESTALVHGHGCVDLRFSYENIVSLFCYVYILHTKDEALDKFKVFKTEVELQQGSLIKRFGTDRGVIHNKRNKITPYELWTKKKPNLNYLRVWGCRAVVRLPDPKLKTLGERVSINAIIESRGDIFDENKFSSVPRPSQRSLINGTEDIGGLVVPEEITEEVVVQQP